MTAPNILIIDDDPDFREEMAALLSPNFSCKSASNGEAGIQAIDTERPDAVLLDLILDGRSGLEILDSIQRIDPALPVVMVTNHPSSETEAAAIARGACYYVRKSVGRSEILAKLEMCLRIGRITRQRDAMVAAACASTPPWVCASSRMRELDRMIARVAAAPSTTVLLTGESGTGKSHVAREIHRRSARGAGPFVDVLLSATPETLVDSQLFGHSKGGFTDAKQSRLGVFEMARGGTLLLDEIGCLSLGVQLKLLKALEERLILPIGSDRPIAVDVRAIAATHRNLREMVARETFRQDLYGRLSVITIEIPALRDHPEDIPALAEIFLARSCAEIHVAPIGISPEGMERLQRHSWRSNNIRELRNTIERAVVLHADQRQLGSLHFDLEQTGSMDVPEGDYHEAKKAAELRFKRAFFGRAFKAVGGSLEDPRPGDVTGVAARVGLPPFTIRRILEELDRG